MEATSGEEVRHKVSLLSGTIAPPFPSRNYLLNCGIVPEKESDDKGKSSAPFQDSLAIQYKKLAEEDVESLVDQWDKRHSGGNDDDSSDDESEVRRCLDEMMLSADEKSSLMELLTDAPNGPEWWRAANMFWRRSVARSQARRYSTTLSYGSHIHSYPVCGHERP
jgi:hypothetical protein